MGGMQRRKGAVREREAVQAFVSRGILAYRTAQRMGSAGDAADIVLVGARTHVEVKGTEKLKWAATIAQCERDAQGKPWVIMHRTNRGRWMVIQTLEGWIADSADVKAAIAEQEARRAGVPA